MSWAYHLIIRAKSQIFGSFLSVDYRYYDYRVPEYLEDSILEPQNAEPSINLARSRNVLIAETRRKSHKFCR